MSCFAFICPQHTFACFSSAPSHTPSSSLLKRHGTVAINAAPDFLSSFRPAQTQRCVPSRLHRYTDSTSSFNATTALCTRRQWVMRSDNMTIKSVFCATIRFANLVHQALGLLRLGSYAHRVTDWDGQQIAIPEATQHRQHCHELCLRLACILIMAHVRRGHAMFQASSLGSRYQGLEHRYFRAPAQPASACSRTLSRAFHLPNRSMSLPCWRIRTLIGMRK